MIFLAESPPAENSAGSGQPRKLVTQNAIARDTPTIALEVWQNASIAEKNTGQMQGTAARVARDVVARSSFDFAMTTGVLR